MGGEAPEYLILELCAYCCLRRPTWTMGVCHWLPRGKLHWTHTKEVSEVSNCIRYLHRSSLHWRQVCSAFAAPTVPERHDMPDTPTHSGHWRWKDKFPIEWALGLLAPPETPVSNTIKGSFLFCASFFGTTACGMDLQMVSDERRNRMLVILQTQAPYQAGQLRREILRKASKLIIDQEAIVYTPTADIERHLIANHSKQRKI